MIIKSGYTKIISRKVGNIIKRRGDVSSTCSRRNRIFCMPRFCCPKDVTFFLML
jgi:hypothetical protein